MVGIEPALHPDALEPRHVFESPTLQRLCRFGTAREFLRLPLAQIALGPLPVAEVHERDHRRQRQRRHGPRSRKGPAAEGNAYSVGVHLEPQRMQPQYKLIVVVVFIGILVSLGSALYQLSRHDKGDSKKMVRALAIRVGLSVALVPASDDPLVRRDHRASRATGGSTVRPRLDQIQ